MGCAQQAHMLVQGLGVLDRCEGQGKLSTSAHLARAELASGKVDGQWHPPAAKDWLAERRETRGVERLQRHRPFAFKYGHLQRQGAGGILPIHLGGDEDEARHE